MDRGKVDEDNGLGALLREILERQLGAQTAGDAEAAMSCIHTASPVYEPTRRMLEQLVLNFRLSFELQSFDLVATDEEFAYVRAGQKTRRLEGPDFQDNVTDLLAVMRREKGAWRIWNQVLLHVTPLRPQRTDCAR